MSNINKNTFYNKNFSNITSLLETSIKEAIDIYWDKDINIITYAINNFKELREEKIVEKVDFFSSQMKVQNQKPVIIRLSKELVENLLDGTLKQNSNNFSLRNLTGLEINILNNFSEFLYKKMTPLLAETKNAKIDEKNINFLFQIAISNGECSKLMVSIPQNRLKIDELKLETSFQDEDFINSLAYTRIKVGSTKITLEELENLAQEDIVVLEKSKLTKLTLISGEVEKEFSVKPDPSLILKITTDEENDNNEINNNDNNDNEVTMEKNLWDDIQIEISAEFEKVKMTIGELKQITQGQIVELGSVFNNEISLYVENKAVAKGELLIINDKYAIKLNKILNTQKPQVQQTPKTQAKPMPQQPQVQPKVANQQTTQLKSVPPRRPIPAKPAMPQSIKSNPTAKPANTQQIPKKPVENEEFDYSDFEK